MGLILDTDSVIVGIERRRESYQICDLKRVFQPNQSDPRNANKSKHVFAYADGEIELSATFLDEMLDYFERHPEERVEVRKRAKRLILGRGAGTIEG